MCDRAVIVVVAAVVGVVWRVSSRRMLCKMTGDTILSAGIFNVARLRSEATRGLVENWCFINLTLVTLL